MVKINSFNTNILLCIQYEIQKPGESFNGMMFYTTFRHKIVYVRPQDHVIPPSPKVARSKKSKKTASLFEESLHDSDDSTISEFGTERSADEENEILQANGLSTVENSCNTAVDVISDPSISESLVSQNSNSSNTNTEQEIPPVIDLTSDYAYAAMFDEQLDEILSDKDETNDFPTSSEKVLLGDLTESLFLPLRKFQSNSWMILASLRGLLMQVALGGSFSLLSWSI